MANSVDPDKTPHSAADLCLHCLLKPGYPNTQSKYGNMIKSNPSKILLDQSLLFIKKVWLRLMGPVLAVSPNYYCP